MKGRPKSELHPKSWTLEIVYNLRGVFFMTKTKGYRGCGAMRTHSPDFKVTVVEDLIQNHLSYGEVSRKYDVTRSLIRRWERIYLEEGPEGLSIERRGRTKQTETGNLLGRPMSLGAKGEEDLIAELQRLRMENAYLKKLNALVQAKGKFSK